MAGSEGRYRFVILDIPALLDEHLEQCGFYWAACYEDELVPWTPGTLYESVDGEDFYPVCRIDNPATIGVIRGTSWAPNNETEGWDRQSSFLVEIVGNGGELESVTEDRCTRGVNMFYVSGEILGACDAPIIAPKTYRLSNLIRGMRDTSAWMKYSSKAIGGTFVNLSGPGIRFRSLPLASVGTDRWYKAVPGGGIPAEVKAQKLTITGKTLRPFAPFDGSCRLDPSSGLLRFSWIPRTRALVRAIEPCSRPVYDEDLYRLELLDQKGSVIHVEEEWKFRTFDWDRALQKGEGQSGYLYDVPSLPAKLRVYHLSEKVGMGAPLEIPTAAQ